MQYAPKGLLQNRIMMKNIFKISSVCLLLAVMFSSCGDDRSGEYYDMTKENQWIYSAMQEHYLWGDSLPSLDQKQFFAATSKFFSSLLYKGDKVSFFNDTVSAGSYGMTFTLMRDPLSIRPGKVYALVLKVSPGSPAWNSGVKRGTWISAVNGKALSTSSSSVLATGTGAELATEYIDYDDEQGYFWVESDTLSVAEATDLAEDAILVDSLYNVRDNKVGYIALNSFSGDSFAEQAQQIMLGFANAQASDIVLDLRYCSGGTVANAVLLASMLVPASAYSTPFCTLMGAGEVADTVYNYSGQMTNLSDKPLYIILGSRTHGVAELLASSVECTRGTSNVVTLGARTNGGGMMTEAIESPYGFTINPVVSIMYNSNDEALPASGIEAECQMDEIVNPLNIHALGSEQEHILYNIFYLIVNGMLPE